MNMQIKVNRIAKEITPKLYSACDWQLEDAPLDGDEYNAIHTELLHRVVSKIYQEITLGRKTI